MLNEQQEFLSYTGVPVYLSKNKQDFSYLDRIAFATILDFEGLPRILSIIARGYMYGGGSHDIDRAYRALCAWCSIPNKKENATREEWQYRSDFRELHSEFPELVTEDGQGWFYRHVHGIADYILSNPKLPKDIIIRDRTSYGVSRYKVNEKLIYKELERRKVAKLRK